MHTYVSLGERAREGVGGREASEAVNFGREEGPGGREGGREGASSTRTHMYT